MVDPREHEKNRGWIESILRYVPGFGGYLDREARRESDHLTRTYLTQRLQKAKGLITDYQKTIVNSGMIDLFTVCDTVLTKLDTLVNQIKGSVRGYSGFFDHVKVDEERLDRIYEADMKVINDAETFLKLVQDLPAKSQSPRDIASQWEQQLRLVAEKFEERAKILEGLEEARP
jgi:thiamine pyrophosphate-dependent acetolactate synthase large subunit-like protein